MNTGIRNTIASMARPMRLDRLIRRSGQHCIFPFYHTVSPEPLAHVSYLYRVLKPEEFEKDLDQLLLYYDALSLGDYLESRDGKRAKPAMVLTFDDGLKGCHNFIAPLLKKKGIPAVFFLNNKFIDNKGLFYRYKASLLIHQVYSDCRAMEKVTAFLKIPMEQIETSIRMIGWDQRALLDALAMEAELDYTFYMRTNQVYLNSTEIEDLLKWGFDIGAHSSDHVDFTSLDAIEMKQQVRASIEDLQKRFKTNTAYFSFPFTSDGVPREVIDSLLEEGTASALLGTSGLKRTGQRSYIQRLAMEKYDTSALETLKTEYLYYLIKMPLGKNRLRQ